MSTSPSPPAVIERLPQPLSAAALAPLSQRVASAECALTLVADRIEGCGIAGLWPLLTIARTQHERGHPFQIEEMSTAFAADVNSLGVSASHLAEGRLWR
ncbi:MAG: hypothetical protein ACU0CI_02200 [Shimia sp.]